MKRIGSSYHTLRTLLRGLSLSIVLGLGGVFVAALGYTFYIFQGLPDVSTLKDYRYSRVSEVYSSDGVKIGEFSNERRYPVRFEEIPQHVISAFLAAEDARFYQHRGVDFSGIARAMFSNVMKGRYAQGASTITQQLARSLLLETRRKEITRKLKEMVLAWRMERKLTKAEILTLYLNSIYLGHGAHGIGAAAKFYFNRKIQDVNLAEAAILAGLPQRPNDWDPFHSPYMAKRRQRYVLKQMTDERYISEADAEKAYQQDLSLYPLVDPNLKEAAFFTEHVRQYVMGKYGSQVILTQGFRIYTTLRHDFQKVAEESVSKGIREVDKRLGWHGLLSRQETPEAQIAFRAATHQDVIQQLALVRVLRGKTDSTTQSLDYDSRPVTGRQSPYYGETPVKEGEFYVALTEGIQDAKKSATLSIGRTPAILPFDSLQWVTVGTPPNLVPIQQISQTLKVGDVVRVKVEKIDKAAHAVYVSLEQEPQIQGALLSYDLDNGFVRAMVGGLDFSKSKFNCALQAKRQVGSTFKPVIYAAAIEKGFSPSSLVTDAPLVFKYEGTLDADNQGEDWRPSNYGGTFEGDIPLRRALIRSMNIPTVKILNEITLDYAIQYARSLGITAPLPRELSIALGSWSSSLDELMATYARFPKLGKPIPMVFITKIEDGTGKVLESWSPPAEAAAAVSPTLATTASVTTGAPPAVSESPAELSPAVAYVMTDLLRGAIREGTGRAASHVRANIAGKTGTSNDHRDAWFIGYTPELITGVWVGNQLDVPLAPGETGGKSAAPIWAEYMANAVKEYPKGDFEIPEDVVFAYVDRETGRLAPVSSSNRVRVAFKVGTVPNLKGDNIASIGEPGSRMTSGAKSRGVLPITDGEEGGEDPMSPPPKDEETSDFLREGYQE